MLLPPWLPSSSWIPHYSQRSFLDGHPVMLFPCLKIWFAVFHGQFHTSYHDWSPLFSFFFSLSERLPDTFPTIRKVRCALWIILPASGLKLESFFQVQLQNQLARLLGKPFLVRGTVSCVSPRCRAPGLLLLQPTPIPRRRGAPSRQGPPALHTPLCTHTDECTSVSKETYMDRCFQVSDVSEVSR